ncbi:MAG: segregation/condensation protein A [Candidatus Magasanikbacteria bacterium]|nr:segregation/condensation protein A [Candidatus Magasanikbacteria bacterium]
MQVSIHFKLDQFEGPIDLLLQLIEKQKLDINEVSLSSVTEQYLDFVELLEKEKSAEEIANFLMVASRLLLLKSRALLPGLVFEEEDVQSLESQLEIYRLFLEKSKKVQKMWESRLYSIGRKGEKIVKKTGIMPKKLHLMNLSKLMVRLVQKLEPPKPIPKAKLFKIVSLRERIRHLRLFFKKNTKIKFRDFFSSKKEKAEIVITFLALLELVKSNTLNIKQNVAFGEIMIKNK